MKKSDPSHNVSSCSNSFLDSTPPKNLSMKHSDLTPLKKQNKTSKCKKDEDVHSTSSPPPQPSLSGNEDSPTRRFVYPYSPYSSSCSEDSAPEVIWDYTSPEPPSGVARPERKMTIEDFLNNINFKAPSKKPESNYDKFLREWTLTGSDCFISPEQKKKTVRKPKRSAQHFEEMLKLLESFTNEDCISGAKQDKAEASQKAVLETDATVVSSEELNKPTEAGKGKDAALKDDSCIDELWGDVSEDECFVKATQFLEGNEADSTKHSDVTVIESRKIYAALSNTSVVAKTLPPVEKPIFNTVPEKHMKFSFNENKPDAFKCHSDGKDNLHVFEKNYHPIIPDDSFGSWEKSEINHLTFMKPLDSKNISMQNDICMVTPVYSGSIEFRDSKRIGSSVNHNDDLIQPDQDTIHKRKGSVVKNSDFESDVFHDDAILFQPETLLLLDKIESEVSARHVCSPEEITKKKQEAMKRRKQSQQRKEVNSVKKK